LPETASQLHKGQVLRTVGKGGTRQATRYVSKIVAQLPRIEIEILGPATQDLFPHYLTYLREILIEILGSYTGVKNQVPCNRLDCATETCPSSSIMTHLTSYHLHHHYDARLKDHEISPESFSHHSLAKDLDSTRYRSLPTSHRDDQNARSQSCHH